ncbi:MAG: hypothetical protein NT178_13855 [Proteobacteria bacterium]|nr:hypothetical protein [Pseudomonadota bacterium]
MEHKSKIGNGLILVLVFASGIIIWGAMAFALLALIFLPLLFGMGANTAYLYYFGIGLVVACIYGTHIYHKMISDEKEKIGCIITGIVAGLGAGLWWPIHPFIWLYKIYGKWEDERSRKSVLTHLENERKAKTNSVDQTGT